MPWYDGNVPTKWKNAFDRYNGAEFEIEVIFDPDGNNVTLTATCDIASISSINHEKDLDPEFGITPTIGSVTITFNDPEGYFNPNIATSAFYNYTPVGKEIIVKSKNATETTTEKFPVFSGRIDRLPQLQKGFTTLTCSDRRKYILNQKLIGADSSLSMRMKTMDSTGALVDSVTYATHGIRRRMYLHSMVEPCVLDYLCQRPVQYQALQRKQVVFILLFRQQTQ